IVNASDFWIDVAIDRNFDLKTVPMEASAFVASRGIRQSLGRFKSEIFRQTYSHLSDSALGRAPDEFVHLKLKTNIQAIGQDPFDDLARIDPAENRREKARVTT